MISYWINKSKIKNETYIPKYYNPKINQELEQLKENYECKTIHELIEEGTISLSSGNEIGKQAYGTGDIPFVRTSDISNWEIKTVPKQGISRDIYESFSNSQDVREGDILLVKDGTYLIGNNCLISPIDNELLYQSHIYKIRVNALSKLKPTVLFLLLNSPFVQEQIRSVQFTADIIDTIGQRINEVVLPLPQDTDFLNHIFIEAKEALDKRVYGKAFIKHSSKLIDGILLNGTMKNVENFMGLSIYEMKSVVSSDTISMEFGGFSNFFINSQEIRNNIYIPKYYDPKINDDLKRVSEKCDLITMGELRKNKIIDYYTGDEIGKASYGTGNIPFIRTSDFSNWEIKFNPKQGISNEIYDKYAHKQDIRENDILLVRDGTYLIGTSTMVTSYDSKSLFCGGLYKIRCNDTDLLDPFLLLGLLNSYTVKKQIRTKQFTRDVIDTIGNRIDEVVIPIPKDNVIKKSISELIHQAISSRIASREKIAKLSQQILHYRE